MLLLEILEIWTGVEVNFAAELSDCIDGPALPVHLVHLPAAHACHNDYE
jgi:hypothetical protein